MPSEFLARWQSNLPNAILHNRIQALIQGRAIQIRARTLLNAGCWVVTVSVDMYKGNPHKQSLTYYYYYCYYYYYYYYYYY
jgi:hypothetical protein